MIQNAKNKQEAITLHLLKYKQITSLEAIQNYGATRLAHHIFMLRKKGWEIENQQKVMNDRFGNKSQYVNYKLKTK